jgi:GNAT superfamily N-acetyltransferase
MKKESDMESATVPMVNPSGSTGEGHHPIVRRGTAADSRRCFDVMWEATVDLAARQKVDLPWSAEDVWPAWEGLYAHLAEHHAEWWLAEDPGSGEVLGAARSIERGRLFQLTELHVRPREQSRGVGRALIERSFSDGRGDLRLILASNDLRAIARYYATGVVAQLPLFFLTGDPSGADAPKGLTPVPLEAGRESVESILEIDRTALGLERSTEAAWLLRNREGYLYADVNDAPVGYAFIGPGGTGPMAAIHPDHLPEMLAHLEARANAMGIAPLEFTVPGPNGSAMRHLLQRGYRVSPLTAFVMANRPFGRFDRYLPFDPPFIL